MSTDFARQAAAAAAKVVARNGGGQLPPEKLAAALMEEATLYDSWHLHVTRDQMHKLLDAEWRRLRGRQLGGFVSAAARRTRVSR